jgi:hypothetical protein
VGSSAPWHAACWEAWKSLLLVISVDSFLSGSVFLLCLNPLCDGTTWNPTTNHVFKQWICFIFHILHLKTALQLKDWNRLHSILAKANYVFNIQNRNNLIIFSQQSLQINIWFILYTKHTQSEFSPHDTSYPYHKNGKSLGFCHILGTNPNEVSPSWCSHFIFHATNTQFSKLKKN